MDAFGNVFVHSCQNSPPTCDNIPAVSALLFLYLTLPFTTFRRRVIWHLPATLCAREWTILPRDVASGCVYGAEPGLPRVPREKSGQLVPARPWFCLLLRPVIASVAASGLQLDGLELHAAATLLRVGPCPCDRRLHVHRTEYRHRRCYIRRKLRHHLRCVGGWQRCAHIGTLLQRLLEHGHVVLPAVVLRGP